MKKMILSVTILFLLFEVLYFNSNNKIANVKNNITKFVYEIEISDSQKNDFKNEYGSIILEDNENKITFLTDKDIYNEIKNKFDFTVE